MTSLGTMPCRHILTLPFTCFLFLIFIFALSSFVQSIVPPSNTFEVVNEGPLGDPEAFGWTVWPSEYGADYRSAGMGRYPFNLFFYNTTPNAFTLAIGLGPWGPSDPHDTERWVWEANRGKPVQDGAKLKFGSDGNLLLIDIDGQIAWQTYTANTSVVRAELLNNGNLVLVDEKGRCVWQSFYYPTDTLLLGQSLWNRGVRKLVSRASDRENVDGSYSLIIESSSLVMKYWSKKSRQNLVYYEFLDFHNNVIDMVTFEGEKYTYNLPDGQFLGLSTRVIGRLANLVNAKYNSTSSFLRLGADGNLRIFTFDDSFVFGAWDVAFMLFGNTNKQLSLGSITFYYLESQCQLPEKCGNFGICEDNQCVACPTPNGLLGWNKNCQQPNLTSCNVKDFHYYKIEGVDHFMCKYNPGKGPMKENECGDLCTKDCKCLGYFYHPENSLCWIAYDLKTLTKTQNMMHVAYIKAPNK